MTKKRIEPAQPERVALRISKKEFSDHLTTQIEAGKTLLQVANEIKDVMQLEHGQRNYSRWDNVNEEIIKSSFNNPRNEYLQNYKNAGQFNTKHLNLLTAGRLNINDPAYKLDKMKDFLVAKIGSLEELSDSVRFLDCLVPDPILKATTSSSDYFTTEKKQTLDQKIDYGVEEIRKLGFGQEIIFDEINQMKELTDLSIKNWKQILKEKLIELGLSTAISQEVIKMVYEVLTGEKITKLIG